MFAQLFVPGKRYEHSNVRWNSRCLVGLRSFRLPNRGADLHPACPRLLHKTTPSLFRPSEAELEQRNEEEALSHRSTPHPPMFFLTRQCTRVGIVTGPRRRRRHPRRRPRLPQPQRHRRNHRRNHRLRHRRRHPRLRAPPQPQPRTPLLINSTRRRLHFSTIYQKLSFNN